MSTVLDGLVQRHDHILPLLERWQVLQVLCHRLACDRHAGAIDEALLQQILQHSRHSTHLVDVLHHKPTGGLEVGDEGGAVGDALEVVDGQLHARRPRHCQQVQHSVGGPPECHDSDDGVLKGGLGHDVPRLDVPLHQVQDGLAGQATLDLLHWVFSGHAAAVGQGHAQGLDGAGHGVGGVHPPTGARSRAGVLQHVHALLLREQARCILPV
mmetsp:Transcript_4429/g.12766  ORF Transcript_4429/g.12766 Transcript_4429/m.12766 type:complete len:212 (+) Transcript_4429:1437-2072(+)